MPMPSVLPMPPVLLELRVLAPLDAQEASYLAASARMASLVRMSTRALSGPRIATGETKGRERALPRPSR